MQNIFCGGILRFWRVQEKTRSFMEIACRLITIYRKFVQKLADEKGLQKEFALYNLVEKLAPKVIANERHIYKGVSANIDFYSGLVYSMLGIPHELYTPIFAIGRIAGWSAHRLEELVNAGKIIRPAYKAVAKHKPYTPLSERD